MEIISIVAALVASFLILQRRHRTTVCRVCKSTGEILCMTGEHEYDFCACTQR